MTLERRQILLVGDLMLDQYTYGTISRISPEAPVPVLNPQRQESRPGGAGNAALNLVSLDQKVRLLGRVGNDNPGQTIRRALDRDGVDTSAIVIDETTPTPLKNRLIASGQQMMRLDQEEIRPLPIPLEHAFEARLPEILDGVDLVAISDYGKGLLTPSFLQILITAARAAHIPVLIDPKGRDFTRYAGATLLKPNLHEATEAAGLGHEATLDHVADALLAHVDSLLITRSEKGMSLFRSDHPRVDFPVEALEVRDVTGAGDTVLAVLAAALANALPLDEAAELANRAAALAVARFGCARITTADLALQPTP
jgi:D-glycero-beta-D-manno-heptose-7-phosphate kinase